MRPWAIGLLATGLALGCGDEATEVAPGANSASGSSGTASSGGTTSTGTESTSADSNSNGSMTSAGTNPTDPTNPTATNPTTTGMTTDPTTDSGSTGSAPEVCDNGTMDPGETDIDCGGPRCPPCDFGQGCADPGDCISNNCGGGMTCGFSQPLIWLDGLDGGTMYVEIQCAGPNPSNGTDVYCWRSKGSNNDFFRVDGSRGQRLVGQGLELTDDLYSLSGVFSAPVDDVTVFVVQTEINGTESWDFNLNHPNEGDGSRFAARIPQSGGDRRIVFDMGALNNRIQSAPNLIQTGERYQFGFVNSTPQDQRAIFMDGTQRGTGAGNVSATAGEVSIGSSADIVLHEFRIYTPSPTPNERRALEGLLACRWDIRNQLPMNHPYYDADGASNNGCP